MREWLVIENSRAYSVFAPDNVPKVMGYIPRDVVEGELGIKVRDGYHWFSAQDGERMRAHPEWTDDEPPAWSSALGFWLS
jgi:hypothetical protein